MILLLLVVNVELPTKKGDYFEGHVVWDTCTVRKPDVIGIEIMHVKENDYFTPVAEVYIVLHNLYLRSIMCPS